MYFTKQTNNRVVHIKTQKEYVILTRNALFQNAKGEWVDAVSYMSCDPAVKTLFTRLKEDFDAAFTPVPKLKIVP
jgi:hypothetical protein